MRALLLALVIALILIPFPASALLFTDDTQADFNLGAYNRTATDGQNVTLQKDTATTYYPTGDYTSRVFDGTPGARWSAISWGSTKGANQALNMSIRFSNDSSTWTGWMNYTSTPGIFDVTAKHAQYKAFLSTQDISKTPYLEKVDITYVPGPPNVTLTTPPDLYASSTSSVTFGCSAYSPAGVVNMKLYWNYSGAWLSNETRSVSGNSVSTTFLKQNLANNSLIKWGCSAEDGNGLTGWSSNRTLVISLVAGEAEAPSITYTIEPSAVRVGGTVEITATATDPTGVDKVWAVISAPGQANQTIELQNGQPTNYTTLIAGQHAVFIFANDTIGNKGSRTASFSVEELVTINSTVYGYTGSGVSATLKVLSPDTTNIIESWQAADGLFRGKTLIGGTYDLMFSITDMGLLLKGVPTSGNLDKGVGMDRLTAPAQGYARTYGAESSYLVSSASVTLSYAESEFDSEDAIGAYLCSLWGFSNRTCTGTWTKVTAAQDKQANTITVPMAALTSAGISIKQEPYCGDGTCGAGETQAICPADCECSPGTTRACGASDAAPCKMGLQSCSNGMWGTCIGEVAPKEETCNGIDDNCDGTVDNIGNATSVEATACQCYNGGTPLEETCNGIDDNCDGEIDEGIERECGSNIGSCRFGTSRCINGLWGECFGGIEPTEEICEDGSDNDCDGTIDNGCASCTNGIQDGDEEGVDCGGSCPNACFPWMILIVALVVIGGAIAAFFLYFSKKAPTWEELEQKYGAARAIPTIEELEREFGNV
jgi:hypothetical protein